MTAPSDRIDAAYLTIVLLLAAPVGAVGAQLGESPVRVAVGFGVDTAARPNGEIFALWQAYLAGRADSARPNPLWSVAEQARWPLFDLVSPLVYQGFSHYTVVHLAPAVGLDSTYLIRTLVSAVDSSTHDVRPLALYRVYATREGGRWVLGNALPRLTRGWHHETIGQVTFVYPPARRVSRRRLRGTAAFADSLARAFGVAAPSRIGYYFTDDLTETFQALGVDFFPLGSDTVGGRAVQQNKLVFVGSSTAGEIYRHEVAHVVLGESFIGDRTAGLVAEGLMTWTGGSAGLTFAELIPGLRQYLLAHPDVTLEGILTAPPRREGTLDVGYGGLAVLCAMVYEGGGVTGIRKLVNAGREPQEVLRAAAELLAMSPGEIEIRWRARITSAP